MFNCQYCNIIMAEEVLPKISQETREKLASYGFVNHLYDSLLLPSCYIPRASGFDLFTYSVMGLSAAGAVFSKRLGFQPATFVFAFLCAPLMSFIQKKEADTVYNSEFSKRNPALVLQQFPILNQSFKQVSQEVDEEIKKYSERIRLLEERVNRNSL